MFSFGCETSPPILVEANPNLVESIIFFFLFTLPLGSVVHIWNKLAETDIEAEIIMTFVMETEGTADAGILIKTQSTWGNRASGSVYGGKGSKSNDISGWDASDLL